MPGLRHLPTLDAYAGHVPEAAELTTRLRRSGCVAAEREAAALLRWFSEPVRLEAAVRRREAGEPLEHVLGVAELAGVRVAIAAPVFVPRRRTEWLVGRAVELVRQRHLRARAGPPVLDLGCGSGAIAAVLASRLPEAEVLAADIDPDAVACASANGASFGFAAFRSDWLRDLPDRLRRGLGLVVAYLPHVPTDDLPLLPTDFRRAERMLAVHGGPDGLDPLRVVLDQIGEWLAADGVMLTLLAERQLPAAADLAVSGGWSVATRVRAGDALLEIGRQVEPGV